MLRDYLLSVWACVCHCFCVCFFHRHTFISHLMCICKRTRVRLSEQPNKRESTYIMYYGVVLCYVMVVVCMISLLAHVSRKRDRRVFLIIQSGTMWMNNVWEKSTSRFIKIDAHLYILIQNTCIHCTHKKE